MILLIQHGSVYKRTLVTMAVDSWNIVTIDTHIMQIVEQVDFTSNICSS